MNSQRRHINFSYLGQQFADPEQLLNDIRELVRTGDFTLGSALQTFERKFAAMSGIPHAIGVGSGTDAITLSLKMLGVGAGHEVITTPMTFIATVGAIVATGARPVFVDSDPGLVIDVTKIESAITSKTRAIVPVHYTGNIADMPAIARIARKHQLSIVEDACQSIKGRIDGMPVGTWGDAACFSLHPLKNLNVWGDGGVIVTSDSDLARKLRLYRNHGLESRDIATAFGVNSRLDTLQAVLGNRLIDEIDTITARRIDIARRYDDGLSQLEGFVEIPPRRTSVTHVFHLYVVKVQKRDDLLAYLNDHNVEAKIHYPVPVHLQEAARELGYKAGDFPQCEADTARIITLPAHQYLDFADVDYVVQLIRRFYLSGPGAK